VSSPSADPGAAAALARVADELASLRHSVEALTQRLGQLTSENTTLRARLEQSESARAAWCSLREHIVELLADSRREVRTLQQKQGRAPNA